MPDDDSSSDDGGGGSPVERMGSPDYRRANSSGGRADTPPVPTDSFVMQQIGTLRVDKQPREFQADVTEMRERIHRLRSRVWVTSRWLAYLDMAVGGAVLFTSLVSPVDVAMARTAQPGFVFFIGLLCNFIFFVDMCVNFNRAYREETSKGGAWVKDRSRITRHYLRTWFIVDCFAVIPLDMPFVMGMLDATEPGFTVRLVNMLRLVRCLKILQTAPVVINVMLTRLAMTNSSTELLKFSILIGLTVHYMACFWAFVGLNWEPSDGSSAASETTWIVGMDMQMYEMHRLYAVSIYVSIVAIFGGVSSVAPHNFVEYCALSGMMLVGGLAWAYVLSMLCAIFSKLDPRETEHKNMMDELSYFMEERDFDSDHRQRLRDFFNYTKDFAREGGYAQIFERMSNKLRADTALIMGEAHVQLVWYLRRDRVEGEFLCEVALNLRAGVYEIHETLPIKKLTVISRGLVAQRMRLIGAGKVLGIDCIIKEQHSGLRALDPVMCLSFVHVATISRDTLFELAEDYPQATATLKMASRHMTVRASMVHYYKTFVRHNRKLPGRTNMEDVSAEMLMGTKGGYGKNRRSSAKFMLNKTMKHHGDSGAVEQQLDELKAMVAALATAQSSHSSHGSSHGKEPHKTDSSSLPRRRASGTLVGAKPDASRFARRQDASLSRSGDHSSSAERSSMRASMRGSSRGSKEAPGRERTNTVDSKSRRKSHTPKPGEDKHSCKLDAMLDA